MQDRTIDNALIALHKAGGEQAELARQILRLRGVEPPRLILREAPIAKRGAMRRLVLDALRGGPKTRKALVAAIAPLRPDVPPERLYWRVDAALAKLGHTGTVRREGRVWQLAMRISVAKHPCQNLE